MPVLKALITRKANHRHKKKIKGCLSPALNLKEYYYCESKWKQTSKLHMKEMARDVQPFLFDPADVKMAELFQQLSRIP